jgi:hypothetical protein
MRRPAISSLPLLALIAAGAVGGCSKTYGTGQAPEMALFSEVTGGLVGKGAKQSIEYQPRAPLVMPPAAGQLPAPVETAEAARADWPLDPDQNVATRTYGEDYDPQSEYERLKPLAGLMPESRVKTDTSDDDFQARDIIRSKQQRQQFQTALAEAKGYGRTERKYLTEPPTAYRAPAETAPTEFEDIKAGGGGGGFLKWIFRRG